MHRYGPMSYYRLGRVFARERLRDPYSRDPPEPRHGGVLIPPPVPYQRVGCEPPPGRYEAQDAYYRAAEAADSRPGVAQASDSRPGRAEAAESRPGRADQSDSRPGRRDECR